MVWFYAAKLAWPDPIIFFYPRWTIDPRRVAVSISRGGDRGCAGVVAVARSVGRGPLAAVLIFGGVLTPALGFFNVYPFRFSFVADHFQYHAGIALVALAAATAALIVAERAWRHG